MLRKILLVIIIVLILITVATLAIDRFLLPSKVKDLLVDSLSKQTQKSVKLETVEFSIFRGLVLKNLTIYDKDTTFLTVKDADCSFLPLPFFKKEIIIPWININQAQAYLERQPDYTFNISDLFIQRQPVQQSPQEPRPQQKKELKSTGFNLIIKKINIRNSTIYFKDNAIDPAFSKTVDNINANIYLALPAQVKFTLKSVLRSKETQLIGITGIYNIPRRELGMKLSVKGALLSELAEYLRNTGFNFSSGKADISAEIQQKDDIVKLKIESVISSLNAGKDNIRVDLNSRINADVVYGLQSKILKFSGQFSIEDGVISGVETIGKLSGLTGVFRFDDQGFSSDSIQANVLGLSVTGKLKLEDFKKPKFSAQVLCSPELEKMPDLLKSLGKLEVPVKLKGNSKLAVEIRSDGASGAVPLISGVLEFEDVLMSTRLLKKPVTNVSGKIRFTRDSLDWSLPVFIYEGINYSSTGSLAGFKTPDIVFTLKSDDIFVDSEVVVKNKILSIARCNIRYLDSECGFNGSVDVGGNNNAPVADIAGKARIRLDNLNKFFAKQLQKVKPLGFVEAEFSLSGNANDIKSCLISGIAKGQDVVLFGLKADDFVMEYGQKNGAARFDLINMALYSGYLRGSADLDYSVKGVPFSLRARIEQIEIGQLKNDTGLKKNDISGSLSAEISLGGVFDDASKLNGVGKVNIINGKLWQLNLFQGMGKLIFAKDFANINFKEASGFFIVGNKMIKSDNIILNSDLAQLTGSCRIGFDSSLNALINVQVSDKMIPVTGTFKDVATAIMGSANKFGIITISGTLQNPKYQFKTAVVDIMKSVTDAIFQ